MLLRESNPTGSSRLINQAAQNAKIAVQFFNAFCLLPLSLSELGKKSVLILINLNQGQFVIHNPGKQFALLDIALV